MEESINTPYNQDSEQQGNNTPAVTADSSQKTKTPIYIGAFIPLVFLVLIFSLNYFNILPISTLWPKQLGFLPHRPYGQSQQFNNLTMKQSNNPPIVPTAPLTDSTKQTFINTLPNIFAPALIPNSSQITITQNKGIVESFTGTWHINEATAAAIFLVTSDRKSISQLYLSFQKTQTAQPTIQSSQQTTSQFFSIQPKGEWGCKPIYANTMTFCENFWEEADGTRRGLGMQGLFTEGPNRINNSPEMMIFFCEHSKDSKLYSWKSCEYEFAETGVE